MPRAGGILDQDKLFIHVMNYVLLWKSQREELDSKKSGNH